MAIKSVNTNASVFSSLSSINSSNSRNATTLNRVSTGLKVTGALSDASNFAIGQGLRGELKGISALTQGLNATAGAASVATAGATGLSNLSSDIQGKLVELSNSGNTPQQSRILQNDLTALLGQAQGFVDNSSFNGANLLASGSTDVNTIANDAGGMVVVSAQGAVGDAVTALQGAIGDNPESILQNEFAAFESALNKALGSLGADQRQINQQNESLQAIADATEEGLGNIVDADLGRESAQLAAQSVQSQLSIQTFNIANNSTSSLLGLFR